MGNDLSTANVLAPVSFAVNLGAQLYGVFVAKPNMKEIADANHYAFTPNAVFVAPFFAFQVGLQVVWMYKLFANGGAAIEPEQLRYTTFFALNNFCLATWSLFWVPIVINAAGQLYAVSQMPAFNTVSLITQLLAKVTAGMGIIEFFDNGAVAAQLAAPPSPIVQAVTLATFGLTAYFSDWVMACGATYGLLGIASGQSGSWGRNLGLSGVGIAAIVAFRHFF